MIDIKEEVISNPIFVFETALDSFYSSFDYKDKKKNSYENLTLSLSST